MKPHFTAAIAVATLIGGGAALAAAPDAAAPAAPETMPLSPTHPPAPPEQAKAMPGAPDADRREAAAADRSAYFDAHLAGLHAGLVLTPDQEKLWPALDQAIRGFAKMQLDLREKAHDRMMAKPGDADADAADGPMDMLRRSSESLLARGAALKTLVDASEPLYATLSPDQKRRLPLLLRGLTPGGPVGRMMSMLEGNDRPDHPGPDPRWDRRGDGDGMDRQMRRRMADGRQDQWSPRDWAERDHPGWRDRSGWFEGRGRMDGRDPHADAFRDDGHEQPDD